jgi:hypothetical protein
MTSKLMKALAIFLIVRGFLALVPSFTWATQTEWISILEIALGLGALGLNSYKK